MFTIIIILITECREELKKIIASKQVLIGLIENLMMKTTSFSRPFYTTLICGENVGKTHRERKRK